MKFADGQAAATAVSALAQEVLRSMLVNKLKLAVLVLFVVGAFAGGAGFLQARQAGKPDQPREAGKPDRPAADANPQPAPGRMFVTGRVLDPSGKPVPDASVAVYARRLTSNLPLFLRSRRPLPIGDARADGSGRFRIDAQRTSSSRYEVFGAIALVPGYGAGWVELNPDDSEPTADITLRPEQVVQGRLVDVQGQPAANVLLSVTSIHRNLPPPQTGRRRVPDGVFYSGTNVNDFPAWPKPMTTDAEGRFTLRGLGQGLAAALTVHDPRFALHNIGVRADDASQSKPLTVALVPAQVLTGRVTYADTGKPVPHAALEVRSSYGRAAVIISEFETDAEGRFHFNPPPADRLYTIIAFPPQGQPYLTNYARIDWPKGALEQKADLALPRGVLIHGKVTEEGSGKPVAGATVNFWKRGPRVYQDGGSLTVETAADGSFQLGVKPSPGYLLIKGPSDDYVLQAIGSQMLLQGQPGGRRLYAHAHRQLDLKPGVDSQEVNLVIRPGATIAGQVIGPDGQLVADAWIFSRVILDPKGTAGTGWTPRYHANVHNGRFEIHGLDPEIKVPVYFLDPKRKLGGMVNLSGQSAAGGPVTVRLEPCGAARARIVGPDAKPVASRLGPAHHHGRHPRSTHVSRRHLRPPRCRRSCVEQHRHRQLPDRADLRCRGPYHLPRPDPRRVLSIHRQLHVRGRSNRPDNPQGVHRQARRDARPG